MLATPLLLSPILYFWETVASRRATNLATHLRCKWKLLVSYYFFLFDGRESVVHLCKPVKVSILPKPVRRGLWSLNVFQKNAWKNTFLNVEILCLWICGSYVRFFRLKIMQCLWQSAVGHRIGKLSKVINPIGQQSSVRHPIGHLLSFRYDQSQLKKGYLTLNRMAKTEKWPWLVWILQIWKNIYSSYGCLNSKIKSRTNSALGLFA